MVLKLIERDGKKIVGNWRINTDKRKFLVKSIAKKKKKKLMATKKLAHNENEFR